MKSLRILALMMAAWFAVAGVLFAQEPVPATPEDNTGEQVSTVAAADESASATASELEANAAQDEAVAPETPKAPEAPKVSNQAVKETETATSETSDAIAVETPKKDQEPGKYTVRKDEMVGIGQDVHVKENERVNQVVVIFGNAVIDGKVDDQIVVIGGRVKINGPVGEMVLVLSNGELGPDASVRHDAVVVGGRLDNPHGVSIGGSTVSIEQHFPQFGQGLDWFRHGLVMGRPMVPTIKMTWIVAGAFLGFYLFIALILGRAVNATAATLETRPGGTLLASLLFLPALPLFILILAATGIGVLVIPFVMVGTLFAAIFGKVAFLAFVGRAVLRPTANDKVSIAVLSTLIGGIIVALLYGIWYLGFALWALTTWIGIGMVLMTVLGAIKRERPKRTAPASSTPSTAPAASAAAAAPSAESGQAAAPAAAAGSVAAMSAPVSSGLADAPAAAGAAEAAPEGAAAPQPPPAAPPVQATPLPGSPTSPIGHLRAGFGIRLAAVAVDIVLIAGLCGLIRTSGAFALFFGLYTTLLWSFKATSVGGIICGLKIVRLDGRPVDFATAVVRTLGAYLSLVCAGLGFLWVIWDSEMQTWHDKIAGTTVIRVPKGMSLV